MRNRVIFNVKISELILVRLIYASSLNNVIGSKNSLPWTIPSDLKTFKEKTRNSIVVMGRKTYESLPVRSRPLPNRLNVVVSQSGYIPDDLSVLVAEDIHSYLSNMKKISIEGEKRDIWIIGGASIYKQAIEFVDEVHHSLIHKEVAGDAFFNIQDYPEFKLISSDYKDLPEDNCYAYTLNVYKRV